MRRIILARGGEEAASPSHFHNGSKQKAKFLMTLILGGLTTTFGGQSWQQNPFPTGITRSRLTSQYAVRRKSSSSSSRPSGLSRLTSRPSGQTEPSCTRK